MASKARVRSAQHADIEDICTLLGQLGYGDRVEGLPSRLDALLGDPQSDVLVAVDADRIVGLVAFFFVPVAQEAGRWCRITALVVNEQERGGGVGHALAAAAEDAARQAGCSRIEATSALHRDDAHRFYERLGFGRESAHFLKRLPAQRSL